MIKTVFKLMLCITIYAVVFIAANAVLPFSQGFRELGASEDPGGMLFIFLSAVWSCFTILFIIRNTNWGGTKLFVNILLMMFFVQYFMTQIETFFFGKAFIVLTKLDIFFIMLAGLFPLLATIALMIKFFQNKNVVAEKTKTDIKSILTRLGVIGVIYLFVYMIFGYFVAWQFQELRIFYSGTSERLSFFGHMADTIKTNPIIFPFQIIRGILFGVFVLPLRDMISKKTTFIASVCLAYLCTAVQLIIPNVLFPDAVRIAHLIEMSSSMLLFGIIVGNILWTGEGEKTGHDSQEA
jgi:hypothetical protein